MATTKGHYVTLRIVDGKATSYVEEATTWVKSKTKARTKILKRLKKSEINRILERLVAST
jgi:hypothetical protein